jgi:hypothetical protein
LSRRSRISFKKEKLNQQPVRSKATAYMLAVELPGSGLYQNLVLPGPHQLHTTGLHLPYLQQLAGRELCKSATIDAGILTLRGRGEFQT